MSSVTPQTGYEKWIRGNAALYAKCGSKRVTGAGQELHCAASCKPLLPWVGKHHLIYSTDLRRQTYPEVAAICALPSSSTHDGFWNGQALRKCVPAIRRPP